MKTPGGVFSLVEGSVVLLGLLDWPGHAWIGLDAPGLAWIALDTPGLAWIGLDWPGRAWIGLDWPGFHSRLYKRSAPRAQGLLFKTFIDIIEEGLGLFRLDLRLSRMFVVSNKL